MISQVKNDLSKPRNVELIHTFFTQNNLWHNITPNRKAESCKDAAGKRNRLGNVGIPLIDELKSNLGFFIDENGKKNYVLVHCRGNQLLNAEKLHKLFGNEFERISAAELQDEFGLEYGVINPLLAIRRPDLLQVFDQTVLNTYQPPYTMMTNAGHFEWGLEFKASELIKILPNTKVADVIRDETKSQIKVHKVGILTGNSPESGIMLWESMNAFIRSKLKNQFRGDISFPCVIVESMPDMGLSMELAIRKNETRQTVLQGIEKLCQSGATVVAIACNTTYYFAEEATAICQRYGALLISMVDTVMDYIENKQLKQFDFLGIKYVTDFDKWSHFKVLKKSYKVNLPSADDLKKINDLAFEVKRKKISGKGINKLRDLINSATENQYVIIALTELSILLANQKRQKKSNKVYVDTLSLLAERLADEYVEGIKNIYVNPQI